ncbi:tyrosine-type recombinase/integrase [Sphingomonas jatrophae]|uniref:Site-specific recombinase XerD n=1 Tax=Sphingomonas jatrophae TaxID=1166337 RepID=A0A1I6L1D6_9SPHN|nr:tyrosine-type recombinase/integrase [Sphingomonas jatrophae]SFR97267.1 Site-specific recombinase XerD [Sphingomonas jatrophae]
MSLATYLVKRGKRGIWQLRVPIPRALHAPGKPKERTMSMGTTDRCIASDRALAVLDEWKRDWATARGQTFAALPLVSRERRTPSRAELEGLAVEFAHDEALAQSDMRRQQPGGWRRHMHRTEAALNAFTPLATTGDHSLVEGMARDIIAGMGLDLEPGTSAYRQFLTDLSAARMAALKTSYARARGDLEASAESPLVARVRQREQDKAKPGEALLDLFDRYAEQRLAEGRKREDTLKQDRKVIEQFVEFVGADRALASIKAEHIREYRDTLRQLPPKWRDRADMRGLSMREAAAKARAADMPRTALTTVNKHLSTISPLFAWLIKERWDLSNPCTGLFHDKVRGKNPRPPLGTERLNKVLASPLFTGFEADGKEHSPGEVRANDWRYWIPLLCLFTGMRVGEAAQLRTEDVSQHDSGAWIIDIQHAPEKGQTTKAGQSRASMAHAKLVEAGFIEFVKDRRAADGDCRLFPELVANNRHQIGAEPSAFWRDYLTRIGVKAGADGLGAHSFRHELADRLRVEVGLVDDQIAVALGHDQKSTTAGYGAVRQGTVRFLAPVMEQVHFKGVNFEHLLSRR